MFAEWADQFVRADHEAVLSRQIQAKLFPIRDHVESLVADHRIQPDDADIGRLAEEDVAAHLFVFGDFAFFGAAQRGSHVHRSAEALDGLVLVRQSIDEGLFISRDQDRSRIGALPRDDASAHEATGEIQRRQADQ